MKERDDPDPIHVLNFIGEKTAENSQTLIERHNLLKRIGLNEGVAGDLFTVFLGIRLLRHKVYNYSLSLSTEFRAHEEEMFIRGMVDVLNEDVNNAEENMQEYLASARTHLGDVTVLGVAKRIELAANQLIANSTSDDPRKDRSELRFSNKVLSEWGKRWKGEFDDTTLLDKLPRKKGLW